MELEDQALTEITDPHDTDVLCGRGLSGRGGGVVRHPGNKTYLDLVELNKGRYTTCPSAEKIMISRGIVMIVRGSRGRFLERKIDGTWSDIGNKKATSKTSQALRERQSKMRQNISGSNLNGGVNPNTDPRQFFTEMRAIEAPSTGDPHGPDAPVSQLTMDSVLDVNPVESAFSLPSTSMSAMSIQSEMRQNISGALEESHFPGGAHITANSHGLSMEQRRLLYKQHNNLLTGGAIGSESERSVMSDFSPKSCMSMDAFLNGIFISDFSPMSRMTMGAFLNGTLNHIKSNVSILSGGINPNTDPRQFYTAMRAIEAPSTVHLHGPNAPVSQLTMDGVLDVNPVESAMSAMSID
jgi:hypothetical protein